MAVNTDPMQHVAQVNAGWKGGPYFKNPILAPKRPYELVNPLARRQLQEKVIPNIPIIDAWAHRK